jgi:nitroimidazol reductase NimA-like FMN-containing flavoprotein (pyridoxamine 5'-phosphate oxidase superfamily)
MLGELSAQQCADILRSEVIARIGCLSEGRIYVVPVTYVYDGTYIYGHAMEGAKLRAMRANPKVCVEVEHVDNLSNWRSIIAWGTFEECDGPDWDAGFAMLAERILPLLTLPKDKPPPDLSALRRGSVYRIRVEHVTGRFEEVSAD